MRRFLIVLALASPLAAHANKQWGPFPGSGSITISGQGIPEQTSAITQYYGEWYATPKDAHANITLMNSDPWPRSFSVNISLDGHALTQTITHENDSAAVGPGRVAFGFNSPGGKHSLTLRNSDAVTFTISEFDDLNFEATFTGTTTDLQSGASPVRISGAISLHRLKHVELRSGGWNDCDPVIHDAYALVIPRSASDCEMKYNLHVRQTLNAALDPLIAAMEAKQWILKTRPDLKPMDSEMRGTETSPYEAGVASDFYLDRSSAVYQQNEQMMEDEGAKLKAQMNGGAASPQAIQQLADEIAAKTQPTSLELKTFINRPKVEVVNTSKKRTVTRLPGVGTEIEFDDAQPPTGGSGGAPEKLVLVGSWLPPTFEPLGDGEKAVFRGGLNPAKPLLSAQNYYVVIYANRQQAEKVVGLMNWAPIRALLAEK